MNTNNRESVLSIVKYMSNPENRYKMTQSEIDYCTKVKQTFIINFSNDKEIVGYLLRYDFTLIKYVEESLLKESERELMLFVLKQNGFVYPLINENLKNDKDIIISATSSGCYDFDVNSIDNKFKNDREIALSVVKNKGTDLKWFSEHIKEDRDLVLQAVKRDQRAIRYANDALKKDEEIALAACGGFGHVYDYISKDLLSDKQFVLKIISSKSYIDERDLLNSLGDNLKKDFDIILPFLQNNGNLLDIADVSIRNNIYIIKELMKRSDSSFFFRAIGSSLTSDRYGMLELISLNNRIFPYASSILKNDKSFLLEVLKLDNVSIYNLVKDNKNLLDDPDFLTIYNDNVKQDEDMYYDNEDYSEFDNFDPNEDIMNNPEDYDEDGERGWWADN
ncbi:MAG: DUF4116 domain-containing protein [Carnobacterium sp.]|nr:DUF4116 domain-containing protein [Carnobacterium sp.]